MINAKKAADIAIANMNTSLSKILFEISERISEQAHKGRRILNIEIPHEHEDEIRKLLQSEGYVVVYVGAPYNCYEIKW